MDKALTPNSVKKNDKMSDRLFRATKVRELTGIRENTGVCALHGGLVNFTKQTIWELQGNKGSAAATAGVFIIPLSRWGIPQTKTSQRNIRTSLCWRPAQHQQDLEEHSIWQLLNIFYFHQGAWSSIDYILGHKMNLNNLEKVQIVYLF